MRTLVRRLVTPLVALILLACVPYAEASIRYASPTGTGPAATCPQIDPCEIEAAIESPSVMAGDTIVVTQGTYTLAAAVELEITRDITVEKQAGQTRPVIVGSGYNGIFLDHPGAIVRELKVEHSGLNRGLLVFDGLAERMYVHNTATNGVGCSATGTSLLRDSVCWASGDGSSGFYDSCGGPCNEIPSVRNLTAVGSGPGSIGLFVSSGADADQVLSARNVIARGTAFDAQATTDGAPSTSAVIDFTSSNYATTNVSGAGAALTPAGAAGNQTAAALLADAASGNFHQLPGSPTIDGGTSDPLVGQLDLDGNPRFLDGLAACPNQAVPDIGAYELTGVAAAACDVPPAGGQKRKCKKAKKKKRAAAAKKKRCKKKRKKR